VISTLKLHVTNLPYLDSAELFELVADEPWAMFFDSGAPDQSGQNLGRYDILAVNPKATLVFDGNSTQFTNNGLTRSLYGDPLTILQSAIPNCEKPNNGIYLPGAYGYFAYDLARQYESIPNLANDNDEMPQMAMGIYHTVLVVDHKKKKSRVIRMGESEHAAALEQRWLDMVVEHQHNLVAREIELIDDEAESANDYTVRHLGGSSLSESLDWDQYQLAFAKVRQYTKAGDCYQVNLTKRFTSQIDGDPWLTYKSLREKSPAPYGCFMNFPFAQVLSNSPESFIKCRNRKVTTSPIKGTRARDRENPDTDEAIAESLRASVKDRAENLMIVDLMRNDLSRVCELDSVKVPKLFALHSFANVHHLISIVIGKLKEELHVLDLFRSCFPGGSITGAPKIRAMQIIEELEPSRRGLYCGSIAYVGADGDLETSIAIRTIVIKEGVAHFSAGGGLVIDSNVEDEYQELNDKASMMMSAVMARSETA